MAQVVVVEELRSREREGRRTNRGRKTLGYVVTEKAEEKEGEKAGRRERNK